MVALSTIEAKYMAIIKAIKEVLWLEGLYGKLNLYQGVTTFQCVNQKVIHLTRDQMYHERTKHINAKYHYIREIIVEGKVFNQ